MRYALPLTFLLVPFGFLSPGVIHKGHHIALFISVLIILAFQIKNRMARYFMLYAAAWTLFASIFYMTGAIPGEFFSKVIFQMFFLISGGVIYLAVVKSKLSLEFVFNVICISTILQMIIATCQVFDADPAVWMLSQIINVEYKSDTNFIGTLGNINFFSAYLAITLPFFLRRRWWIFLLAYPYFLFRQHTSVAVAAAIIGLTYYVYQTPRCKDFFKNPWHKVGLIVAVLLVIGMCFYWYDGMSRIFPPEGDYRLNKWAMALNQISISWITVIFGLGPGSSWGGEGALHNEWLTIFHRFGIIGLSFVLIYTAKAYRGNRHLFTAFIIICINAIGNLSMHLAPSIFLILIVLGLIEREGLLAHGKLHDIPRTVRGRRTGLK